MAREILWYRDITPGEETAQELADKTFHGSDAAVDPAAEYEDIPGKGKVLTLDNAGDVATVAPGSDLWTWIWGFNWTYANRNGVGLTAGVAGVWDEATAMYYQEGLDYKVKIEAPLPGGGAVLRIRGVYLASEEFTWDNLAADPYNPDIVNFYSSFANDPANGETVITLTGNPGAEVQLYYIYDTGQALAQYDGTHDWPVIQYWQQGEWWAEYWACDKIMQLMQACWLYEQYSGRSTATERAYLWDRFKTYVPERTPPLIVDGFDRASWARGGTNQYFRNSTLGNIPMVFKNFGLVTDPDGSRCLRFHAYLPDSADAAWFGSWLGIDDLTLAPWDTLSAFVFDFRGNNLGGRLFVQLNGAQIKAPDKYTNPEYVYHHAVPDWITEWTEISIDTANFWRLINVYDDGDRIRGDWYAYTDQGTVYSVVDQEEKITVDGEVFYTTKKATVDVYGYSYFGVGVSNTGSNGDPAGQSELNFLYKGDQVFEGSSCQIQVWQTGDAAHRTYTWTMPEGADWSREAVDFADFSPPLDDGLAVEYIQWQVSNPRTGSFYLGDVKFGEHQTFADNAAALYLWQFYVSQGGVGSHEYYLDDVRFGPSVSDPYPYTPPLSICLTPDGVSPWQGPTLVHYVQPMAPYMESDTTVLATWLEFLQDAQDEYYSRYGGVKGPCLPLHSRNFLEVNSYIGGENFNKFCWGSTYRNYGKVKGLWLFNGALADSSDNGHDFTWLGGGSPAYAAGICQPGDTAIDLDGSHSLQVNDHADFDPGTGDWSLALAFKTATQNRVLLDKTGGGAGYKISLDGSGYVVVWVGDGVGSASVTGAADLADGEYHLVTVRYTAGEADGLAVDIDGAEIGTDDVSALGSLDNGGHLIVGADASYANAWIGQVDYLKIWRDYAIPAAESTELWSSVNCTGIPTVYPETSYAYATHAWAFAWVAEYYYFTGDTDAETWLSNVVAWLIGVMVEDGDYPDAPKGYQAPDWFWESGYGWGGGYDPEIHAAIARGMLFYYWRTGDSDCDTWIRRLLDDLRVNRWDSVDGGYVHDGKHRAYVNGYIFRLWGLACNGRPDGTVNPPGGGWSDFTVDSTDTDFYEEYAAWFLDNASDTLPAVLNADNMPYVFMEDEEEWEYWPNYVFRAGMGSTESMLNVMLGALEWGRYSSDYSWFLHMKDFTITSGLNLSNFTLEAWINPSSAHTGDILNKDNAYRLSLNSGYLELSIYNDSAWQAVTAATTITPSASWSHVAAVFADGSVTLYLNGVEVASDTVTGLPDMSADDLVVGGITGRQFYGSIGEVLIRNMASTVAQVRTDMVRWMLRESMQVIELIEVSTPSQTAPLCFCTASEAVDITSYNYLGYPVRYEYTPFGWDRGGIRREMLGSQLTVNFRLAGTPEMLAMLNEYDIRGQEVVIKTTYLDADHNDPAHCPIIFVGEIKSWSAASGVLDITASNSLIDLGAQIPPHYFDYFCRHYFKRNRCLYVGSETECQKTETFCDSLGNVSRFGGFKFVPRLMRRRGV